MKKMFASALILSSMLFAFEPQRDLYFCKNLEEEEIDEGPQVRWLCLDCGKWNYGDKCSFYECPSNKPPGATQYAFPK